MSAEAHRISILYVIDGLEYGGGERTFLQLIQYLPTAEYHIHVATNPDGTFSEKLHELGIQVHPFDLSNKLDLSAAGQLRSIIRKHQIDIVHCQGARADFFSRMAVKNLEEVRLINTIAMPVEGFDVNPWLKWIYQLADRCSERFVDRFIVVSDRLRKTLTHKHHIPAEKVTLIYNGIELKEYDPNRAQELSAGIREEFGIDKETFLVAAVGRLVWQKGFEYLVDAARKLTSDDIKVLIVGDGPQKNQLQQLVSQYGLENRVIFTGLRQDVHAVLACADVIAIPSLLEGFPMITLEAMAMGKPIVASCINGINEQIVDGQDGILVPPKNPKALKEAVEELKHNPDLCKKLAFSARKKAKQFSLERMLEETERVYRKIT